MEVRVRKLEGSQPVKPGPASAGVWVKKSSDADDNVFCYSASEDGVDTTFELPHAGQTVKTAQLTFTEQAAGTYTGTVSLPAGAVLVDIIINGVVLWAAGTSASMEIGDATDPDGYFTAVDLKATDLLAGESVSFALAGGLAGAYIANSQVSPRYSATARDIVATVTQVGTGTAGRTRVNVIWIEPTSADSSTTEATFEAA